jgi:hypothetical protein
VVRFNGIEIDPATCAIRHRGREWKTWRKNSQVFLTIEALIIGGGMSTAQLFWRVFGHDPDGGPMEGPHIFHIRFNQWRPIFEKLDLELRMVKLAGVAFYQLVPIHRF